jgi:hypothetical protein
MTASILADNHHTHDANDLASSNGMEQNMNSQNSRRRNRRVVTAITALGLVALGSACSGEDLAESMIERQVESETGEDFDLNINAGCVSIRTEEGSMTCDEDGNVIIETPDGSAVMNVDDAGNIQMTGDDGESVDINTDADGNTIINTPEGSVVAGVNEDGNYEVSAEGGQFTASTGGDVPDEFPSDIAIPSGFEVVTSSVMGDSEMTIVSLTLKSSGSVPETVAALSASLEAAGYTEESNTTAADAVFAAHSKGESQVVTTYSLDADGVTLVGISVQT